MQLGAGFVEQQQPVFFGCTGLGAWVFGGTEGSRGIDTSNARFFPKRSPCGVPFFAKADWARFKTSCATLVMPMNAPGTFNVLLRLPSTTGGRNRKL